MASHVATALAKEDIRVPDEATKITTPLVPEQWHRYLDDYPDKMLMHFFISGIRLGFRLGCKASSSTLKLSRRNLMSTLEHPEVVEEYLATKLRQSRIAGPFKKATVPNGHISRFGVIPKKASGKWRLIVDLSHPLGASFDDTIPKKLWSLTYISVDTAIQHILKLGPGTLLAKLDVMGAFRLLLIYPADRHLLAVQ